MSAIQSDAAPTNEPTALTAETASEVFLKQWEAASPKTPAKSVDGEKRASGPVDPEYSSDDSDEELLLDDEDSSDPNEATDEQQTAEQRFIEDDEALVKVSVDGEELSVSVKELKRLAGQEASLTRKSMELATRRKEAEEIGAYHAAALVKQIQMAEAEYAPYANIDFLVAAKELSAEDLRALREEANAKYEKYRFLTSELETFQQQTTQHRAALMQQQAQATIQELTDPEKGIPGWSPKLYEEVGNYAISRGMRPEAFLSILDAPSLRILYEAYRYDKAKKVSTKKKAVSPQSVLKSSASPDSGRFNGNKAQASMSKLRKSGSRDDAVGAILAKWGVE